MATIAENLQSIIDAKADIKAALIEQGQNPTDKFSTYGNLVRAIEGGGSGGDDDHEYLGQLIPRVSEASANITASSYQRDDQAPWHAFDGISPSNLRDPANVWIPTTDDTTPWIQYEFDEKRYIDTLIIIAESNYSTDWVGDIYVEGSLDGSQWVNILKTSTTYKLTAGYQKLTLSGIKTKTDTEYKYIRIRGTSAFNVYYQPSLFIDEIYVLGGKIKSLDPNYTYHKYGSNDEIIVRVYHEGESDQHIWWFFRGWDQIADQMEVPSDLVPYVPNNPGHAWTTANYPKGGTTQNGWVGFINGRIGVWSTDWYHYLRGLTYGSLDASVMEPINTSGDVEQTNAYVDNPYIYL